MTDPVTPISDVALIASVITAAIASVTSIVLALINSRKADTANRKMDDLHVSVNGRLTQLLAEKDKVLEVTKDSSFKAGQKDEKDRPGS